MKVDVLLGLQWGDEGKGKIVDVLTPKYDIIARFQGGPNAGHSLEFNKIKHVLHTIPSGIFHINSINVIGNGVVIDPVVFAKEIEVLRGLGLEPTKNLIISKKAHLIIPSHRELDAASEASKGKEKIGSTLKGIGPTYMDKTGRNGIRIGDIIRPDFMERYNSLKMKHINVLKQYDYNANVEQHEEAWFAGLKVIKEFKLIDSEYQINSFITQGKKILAEGAQGSLLDIDFGSYPYVTSSNTICAGACTGLGIAPHKIGQVLGIFKAYCTRVGSGPFPSELDNPIGQKLRDQGREYGSTTGRPRRCGWLDMVALKYSVMINGVTSLIMTKADVLDTFDSIKVATAYKVNGELSQSIPFDMDSTIEPIYKEFKGWNTSIANIRKHEDLPVNFKNYVEFIEKEMGIPISIISVGPDREETIIR
jgi:adenylosuccinate synthase